MHTAAAAAKLLQSCPTLCDPTDGSPPGSPVPGILQARTLEWVAISFSDAWKWKVKVKSLSCVRLCNPIDGSPPGIHPWDFSGKGTEWVSIAFSDMHTTIYKITNKDLLYSTGNYTQYFVITYKGKIWKCVYMCLYIYTHTHMKLVHCAVYLKLTWHYKPAIFLKPTNPSIM